MDYACWGCLHNQRTRGYNGQIARGSRKVVCLERGSRQCAEPQIIQQLHLGMTLRGHVSSSPRGRRCWPTRMKVRSVSTPEICLACHHIRGGKAWTAAACKRFSMFPPFTNKKTSCVEITFLEICISISEHRSS